MALLQPVWYALSAVLLALSLHGCGPERSARHGTTTTTTKSSPAARPHILFMMADQMRWDILGLESGSHTPSLDKLAREGLKVRYAVSSTPTCTPARAALLTGRSPWHHGMLGYGSIAPRYPLELPRVLADAGYHTASIGKNHFGWNLSADTGIKHGFESTLLYDGLGRWNQTTGAVIPHQDDYDRWFAKEMPGQDPQGTLDGEDEDGWNTWYGRAFMYEEHLHPTAWTGQQAVDFLQQYSNSSSAEPFFLKVSFHRPHSPYDPPRRLLDSISGDALPPVNLCQGANSPEGLDNSSSGARWCLRFRGQSGDPPGCGPTADAWCGLMPESDALLSRRAYVASVKFVDEWVGRIYDVLVERQLLERTWILWTSDHGDGQGDMFHWRKGYPYEFSAHVPMLLRWPASWAQAPGRGQVVARGSEVLPPVVTELRDVFHTLIDAAGIAENASLVPAAAKGSAVAFAAEDGKSMLCLLQDPSGMRHCQYAPNPGPWRRWIDMEHSTCYNATNHWSALTDGRMKYVFKAWNGDEQLFNLTSDPGEGIDVSDLSEYAAELRLWRGRLVAQFQREGRGSAWVKDGELVSPRESQTYSPNYPKSLRGVHDEISLVV